MIGGATIGGIPGAMAGAALGDLTVRGTKALGRKLDGIGRK